VQLTNCAFVDEHIICKDLTEYSSQMIHN